MIGIRFSDIFHAEIINNKGKGNVPGGMLPKIRSARYRGVAELGKMGLQAIIGYFAGLLEAGHALADFHIDPAVRGESAHIVLLNDFLRDEAERNFHVFKLVHGSVVIKILDVECQELDIGSGYGTVQEAFCGGEAGTLSCGDTNIVEFVASESDADSVCFCFVGLDGRHKASICYFLPRRYIAEGDKENSVGSMRHSSANSLRQSAKIVGEALDPESLIGSGAEVPIF